MVNTAQGRTPEKANQSKTHSVSSGLEQQLSRTAPQHPNDPVDSYGGGLSKAGGHIILPPAPAGSTGTTPPMHESMREVLMEQSTNFSNPVVHPSAFYPATNNSSKSTISQKRARSTQLQMLHNTPKPEAVVEISDYVTHYQPTVAGTYRSTRLAGISAGVSGLLNEKWVRNDRAGRTSVVEGVVPETQGDIVEQCASGVSTSTGTDVVVE